MRSSVRQSRSTGFPRCSLMKYCPCCASNKEPDQFGKNRSTRDGLAGYCRECSKRKQREWYASNTEKARSLSRAWKSKPESKVKMNKRQRERYEEDAEHRTAVLDRNVWSKMYSRYGVTRDRYEQMLEKQNGVCAICKEECKTRQRLVVDHDHATGQVRGLLCKSCNFHLGVLERHEWVEKAQRYLHER